jgi:hypothetical protein
MRYETDIRLEVLARLSTAGIVMQRAPGISLQTMKIHCRDVPTDFVLQVIKYLSTILHQTLSNQIEEGEVNGNVARIVR